MLAVLDSKRVSRALLRWYDRNRRDLPWRNTRDPYAVWVSEVMLQQTQAATVERYYARFLERFPNVESLARASDGDVLHAWQGLGYYSRARRLKRAAELVVRGGGRLPERRDELLKLPGLGRYSAGAIASIAYGERVAVLDGNVIRVLTRLGALAGDPECSPLKQRLWSLAESLVPEARPGDFNQALMELGATRCTPRAPRCSECPLAALCVARAGGKPEAFPELAARAEPTRVRVAAAVVRRGGDVLVERIGTDATRWTGLWTFPSAELNARETARRAAERAAREAGARTLIGERLTSLSYSITRFRMTLDVFDARIAPGARPARSAVFHPLLRLEELAMPAPHRRLARLLAASEVA